MPRQSKWPQLNNNHCGEPLGPKIVPKHKKKKTYSEKKNEDSSSDSVNFDSSTPDMITREMALGLKYGWFVKFKELKSAVEGIKNGNSLLLGQER